VRRKILIADDEIDILKVVIFRLKKAGYKVFAATDGREALDILNKQKIDLLILDLKMPVMDGFEVYNNIRAEDKFRNLKIIVLSASSGVETKEEMKKLDISHYFTKPFDPGDLLAKIKNLLEPLKK
jgi:DNA-binding response OmpR family regulator